MKKIFTFFAVVLMSVSMNATVIEHVQIGDLYYNLDSESQTAAVTWEKRIDITNYHGLCGRDDGYSSAARLRIGRCHLWLYSPQCARRALLSSTRSN